MTSERYPDTPDIGVPELAELARLAGLLSEGQAIAETELNFAYRIITLCSEIGDQYGDPDCNAGDHIRAALLP